MPVSLEKFRSIQDSLHEVFGNDQQPKEVRRRVLEAAVRAPQEWQLDAVKSGYVSGDQEWMLTAVFAMGYVPGFEAEILEALENADTGVHTEAVRAAGRRELDEAWPHVVELAESPSTDKPLRIAAIEAMGNIRPNEAVEILLNIAESEEDEEIAAAADESMAMAQAFSGDFEDEEDIDEGKWVN